MKITSILIERNYNLREKAGRMSLWWRKKNQMENNWKMHSFFIQVDVEIKITNINTRPEF